MNRLPAKMIIHTQNTSTGNLFYRNIIKLQSSCLLVIQILKHLDNDLNMKIKDSMCLISHLNIMIYVTQKTFCITIYVSNTEAIV